MRPPRPTRPTPPSRLSRSSRLPRPVRWLRRVDPRRLLSSVRFRMTLWYLAILALVFIVFGAIVSGIAVRDTQTAEESRLIALSQQVAGTYNSTDGQLNLDGIAVPLPTSPGKPALVKGYPISPEVVVLLVDSHGTVVQSVGPQTQDGTAMLQELVLQDGPAARFGGPVPVRSFDTVSLQVAKGDGQSFTLPYAVFIAPITSQGHQVATLLVGEPSDPSAVLKVFVPGLFLAGPATLLVAAVGGYWLAARALRPVRVITRTAHEIEETDLSRRLNISSRDELGELAATFDAMLARLEAAFARQRQFTADASHELRTPLAIVSLEARRALAGERTPAEYERALATIQAESDYMRRLVESLLTLARADAGQANIERADVDLSDVVVDAVERLAPLARERGVTLAVGTLAELTVEGDALLLAQMVGNLVENAVKHGRPGGHVDVDCSAGTGASASASERAGWAFVRVADNGPGIPAAHLPHIFDRFYRADTSRSRADADAARNGDASSSAEPPESAGLGLAIVRWGAEAHGGEVTVSSAEGTGSTFTLWLPLPITAPIRALPTSEPARS